MKVYHALVSVEAYTEDEVDYSRVKGVFEIQNDIGAIALTYNNDLTQIVASIDGGFPEGITIPSSIPSIDTDGSICYANTGVGGNETTPYFCYWQPKKISTNNDTPAIDNFEIFIYVYEEGYKQVIPTHL